LQYVEELLLEDPDELPLQGGVHCTVPEPAAVDVVDPDGWFRHGS
jgi:hypothetical protein